MAASIAQINGTITARVGDNDPVEVATFTLPLTISTELLPCAAGVVITTGADKLTRAMRAFQAVIDEE
jgi:hypothetical protein